jgi:hypothetical protein
MLRLSIKMFRQSKFSHFLSIRRGGSKKKIALRAPVG